MTVNEREAMNVLGMMDVVCGRLVKNLPYGEEQVKYRHMRSAVRWLRTESIMKDAASVLKHVCPVCPVARVILDLGEMVCDQWSDFEQTQVVTSEMIAVTDACYIQICDLYQELKQKGCICETGD